MKRILFRTKKKSKFIQGKSVVLIYIGMIQTHNLEATGIMLNELKSAVR
ncbi:hypothetical protein [Flavobacterium franklandianum]|nr:hypothetical protein [Flavobacterium franklandianum]